MSRYYTYVINPGTLGGSLTATVQVARTLEHVVEEFRDHVDNHDSAYATCDVNIGDWTDNGPDYRLSVGPRGGITKQRVPA